MIDQTDSLMREDHSELVSAFFLLALLAVVIAAPLAYSGQFYVTGSQFYAACWELKVKAKAIGGFKDPEAGNPSQAILWANCTPIAARGIDEAGFSFGSSASNAAPEVKALVSYCPNRETDVPLFLDFIYIPVIEWIEKAGGPSLIDHVAPAEWLVGRAARARWPRCAIAVIEVQDRIKRARAASGRSADDQQALEWANANSNDPRAAEIKRVLGVQ